MDLSGETSETNTCCGCSLTLLDLTSNFRGEEKFAELLKYLQEHNLVLQNKICERCGRLCRLYLSKGDRRFRCTGRKKNSSKNKFVPCNFSLFLFKNTFFENVKEKELYEVEPKIDAECTDPAAASKRIPSYVGVSCAVSGYRPINKYDALIREGIYCQGSPTRIALAKGHDSKGPIISPTSLTADFASVKGVSLEPDVEGKGTGHTSHNMDSMRQNMNGHTTSHCTRVIEVERFSNLEGNRSSLFSDKGFTTHCGNGVPSREEESKSFVQQRIERLYGPAALGMAFQAKRAMLEKYKERERETSEEKDTAEVIKNTPPGLPSVFRHLRPEFRHQLPVKAKSSSYSWRSSSFQDQTTSPNNTGMNGHRVRQIPIELEEDDSRVHPSSDITTSTSTTTKIPMDKSWKTMSRDLQALNNESMSLVGSPKKVEEVVSPSIKRLDLNKNIKSSAQEKSVPVTSQDIEKDGHYFLKVVAGEVALLEPKIDQIEKDLNATHDDMTEEVRGKLLAASGKAKLLIRQKVEQFKGLCQKNISKSSSEEFPTTNEDIAGFWDMVSIQVENVKDTIAEIDTLRKNNWKEPAKKAVSSQPVKRAANRKVVMKGGSGASDKDPAKEKAAEERRRQLREAMNAKRKQATKLKTTNNDAEVEIFVPGCS